MSGRSVGHTFDAAVIDVSHRGGGTVALREPAVRATCDGDLPLGESVRVRLLKADVESRSRFALARAPLPWTVRRTSRPGGRVE